MCFNKSHYKYARIERDNQFETARKTWQKDAKGSTSGGSGETHRRSGKERCGCSSSLQRTLKDHLSPHNLTDQPLSKRMKLVEGKVQTNQAKSITWSPSALGPQVSCRCDKHPGTESRSLDWGTV